MLALAGRSAPTRFESPPSADPELVGDDAPERVDLVVSHAGRDEVDPALVDQGDPRCAVDQLAVDPRPKRRGGPWCGCLQRLRTEDFAIDPRIAELVVSQRSCAGEPGREEAVEGIAPAGRDQL